jgi:alkylhydroperoxidase family enzyme
MARVPYLDVDDLSANNKDLLKRPIWLNRALAHSPDALRAMNELAGFIRHKSTLDGRLRELAILQIGWLAKSPYEWSHHIAIGKEFGATDDDIRAIGDETLGRPTQLDEVTKLVLRGAREMNENLAMSDATYEALERRLGRAHMIDLIMTISFYCAVVRILATLQIDVEPEYMKYLEQHPLPG